MSHFLDRLTFFRKSSESFSQGHGITTNEPRDWEDMARGPDEEGRSSLWLGDIGDNNAVRENGLLVHRVLEPEPSDRAEVKTEPPTFLLYVNDPALVHFTYLRFLENQIRETFPFKGTPIQIVLKKRERRE